MNDFSITSSESAKVFEQLLLRRLLEDMRYLSKRGDTEAITSQDPFTIELLKRFTINCLRLDPLDKMYTLCDNDSKLFSILFDIKLTLSLIATDVYQITRINNNLIADKDNNLSPEEQKIFDYKYDIYRLANSFVFRFRACMDKTMGAYIYGIYGDAEYEKFESAKSRRKYFLKKEPDKKIDTSFFNLIRELEKFDNLLRTPEAHGAGKLRKVSFLQNNLFFTDSGVQIIEWFNRLLDIMSTLNRDYKIFYKNSN